jgi:hypothetical protein
MSYRGKRSRIPFAITATFVIFGSTASSALPPQAITEEVKSCKAIPNDQQRLKCFDSLFADKPNPPNAADKSASEGNWQIEESKSPTDGSLQIVAANLVGSVGTTVPGRGGSYAPRPSLSACKNSLAVDVFRNSISGRQGK